MEKTTLTPSGLDTCQNCKFGKLMKTGGGALSLFCCYNPPALFMQPIPQMTATGPGLQWVSNGGFIGVEKDSWCGKFERSVASTRN